MPSPGCKHRPAPSPGTGAVPGAGPAPGPVLLPLPLPFPVPLPVPAPLPFPVPFSLPFPVPFPVRSRSLSRSLSRSRCRSLSRSRPRSLRVSRAPGQAAAAVAGALHGPARVIVGSAQLLGSQLQEGRPAESGCRRRCPSGPGPGPAAPGLGRGLSSQPGRQLSHGSADPQQHPEPGREGPNRAKPSQTEPSQSEPRPAARPAAVRGGPSGRGRSALQRLRASAAAVPQPGDGGFPALPGTRSRSGAQNAPGKYQARPMHAFCRHASFPAGSCQGSSRATFSGTTSPASARRFVTSPWRSSAHAGLLITSRDERGER